MSTRRWTRPALGAALATAAVALLVAAAGTAQAGKPPHPYTLVDPGTLGGTQSFMNLPGGRPRTARATTSRRSSGTRACRTT